MNTPANPRDKEAWREAARRARAALDGDAWSAAVVATLRAWPRYRSARTVLTYVRFGTEADLADLARDAKRFVLPRILPGTGRLTLHVAGGALTRHAWGMLEPAADAPGIDPAEVDLALVPGLAFDRDGGRLGYGVGYYDRLLPSLRPGVPVVAVAHPDLVVAALPLEPHDVRASHLLLPGALLSTVDVTP